MSKEYSKGVRIFSLVVSIISVFVLWFMALLFVNNQVEGLSAKELLTNGMISVLPAVIIAFSIAGIVPTLILKLTNQVKKAIITLILTGGLDVSIMYEWMSGDDKVTEITSSLGYGVLGSFMLVAIITVLLIVKSKSSEK